MSRLTWTHPDIGQPSLRWQNEEQLLKGYCSRHGRRKAIFTEQLIKCGRRAGVFDNCKSTSFWKQSQLMNNSTPYSAKRDPTIERVEMWQACDQILSDLALTSINEKYKIGMGASTWKLSCINGLLQKFWNTSYMQGTVLFSRLSHWGRARLMEHEVLEGLRKNQGDR